MPKPMPANVIEIDGADVFLGGSPILRDIRWTVAEGEHWFILGANGAGKSTLTRLVLGYVWPRHGASVTVLGRRYGECDLFAVRAMTAWVSPFLQDWTGKRWNVLEVLVSGLDGTIGLYRPPAAAELAKARETLERLSCADIADRAFADLSSGEQVKALIGRALMTGPRLLVLDEACAHLDMKSREYLLDTVRDLIAGDSGTTVIFVTQRVDDILPEFNRGLVLKHGRVAAFGDRREVLTEENLRVCFDMPVQLVETASGRFWPIAVT